MIYKEPKWYGWEGRGMMWVSDIPAAIKEDFPEAKGWWYLRYQLVPDEALPPADISDIEGTLEAWEKYFDWLPMNYRVPTGAK
ncbi:MAG TPA: hypothetical protein VD973_14355 [Symbiobacteriaceae bacterium]|nr:hypothetical protein [Symbiobacteriaceae bacterium]